MISGKTFLCAFGVLLISLVLGAPILSIVHTQETAVDNWLKLAKNPIKLICEAKNGNTIVLQDNNGATKSFYGSNAVRAISQSFDSGDIFIQERDGEK